jgi:hypothetical protein
MLSELLVRLGIVYAGSKYTTLAKDRMFSPLSRSDLHSAVQPPVNAFGNQAMMTVLPL